MNPHIHRAVRAAALIGCALLPGCSQANATAPKKPTPIKVHSVEQSQQAPLARYSGSIEPSARVELAFRVGGYVEMLARVARPGEPARALDKGDLVAKGEVLARLRSQDYAQKVASARALLSQARSDEKLAQLELERSRRLLESRSITKAEFDTKLARDESARANTEAAQARLVEAQVALGDTLLRAPSDGVVLSRAVEVGTLVAPGQQAVSLADVRSVKAVFGVPQAVVERLALGSPLQVYVGAEGENPSGQLRVDAQVSRIAPSADALGRVFSVEALLPNAAGTLRPGSVVSVHLPGLGLEQASSLPLSAVIRSPAHPRAFSVFVLEGEGAQGRVRLRDVQLGEVLGNSVTVLAGLEPGQRVVTVGSTLLRDGDDAVVIR